MVISQRLVDWLARRRVLVGAASSVVVLFAIFSPVPRVLPLELAFTGGQFQRAWAEWATAYSKLPVAKSGLSALTAFRLATTLDFLFIPSYAALLAAFYIRAAGIHRQRPPRVLTALDSIVLKALAAAAVLDVLENVGLFAASAGRTSDTVVGLTSGVSGLKWAAIAFAVIFIVRAIFSGTRGRIVWLSRYTFASMALGTLPLVGTSQGRDLLLALGDDQGSTEHRAFFYVTLALWGLSVWYWTRVVLDAELQSATYGGLARRLPRLAGAATILLPGFPILVAENDLWVRLLLFGGCAALAGLFLWFVTERRNWTWVRSGPAVAGFTFAAARAQAAGGFVRGSLVVSAALFVWFVFGPLSAGHHFGSLAILFIAAANTVFFGSLAVFASEMWDIRLDVIALACAAAFSFWNDNHDVSPVILTTSSTTGAQFAALPPLKHSYEAWRSTLPPRTSTIVFVIAAEGGGIRAAYWTATVLGLLRESASSFPNQLYAISGVSGGTLGAAVYAALRADGYRDAAVTRSAQDVLRSDFLAPTLAKLVTGDFAQWFCPLPIHRFDRSTAIEAAFSESYRRVTGRSTFTGSITALMPDAVRGIPAVVMNMTVVGSGEASAIAPFTWEPAELPSATQYTCWVGDCFRPGDNHAPPLLAAPNVAQSVHNSARFTYVSPAGHVRALSGASVGHVVDGGYFDPTGVETLLDLARALERFDPSVRVVPIYITNAIVDSSVNANAVSASACDGNHGAAKPSSPSPDASRDAPLALLGELFSPVEAVLGTRAAHGALAVTRQRADVAAITFGFCPMTSADHTWRPPAQGEAGDTVHDPPLGWQLSSPMTLQLAAYAQLCPVNKAGIAAVKNWIAFPGCSEKK